MSPEFYFMFGFGVFLIFIVIVQLQYNKVYTRGRRGFKWNEKSFVSKEEAPGTFWTIIVLQTIVGLGLVLLSAVEFHGLN